jgi:hypothetical protein
MKEHFIIEYYPGSANDWARIDNIEYSSFGDAKRHLMLLGKRGSYRIVKVYTACKVEMTYTKE